MRTRKTTWQGITRAYARRVLRERGFNGDLITDALTEAYGRGHTRVQNADGMNAVVTFGNTDVDTYDVELFLVTAPATGDTDTDTAPAEATEAIEFFKTNAGACSIESGETTEQATTRAATALARAEAEAKTRGWSVTWEIDPEADTEPSDGYSVSGNLQFAATLYGAEGNVLASLCGIDFAEAYEVTPESDPYARVVAAELALTMLPMPGEPAEAKPAEYHLEIMRRDYDTEDYHDGDRGECLREVDDSRTYGDAYDTEDIDGNALTPVVWAVKTLRPMAEFEPSVYPIPGTLGAHTWLSANVPDCYTSIETEVTVYLTGDWTDAQRAEVFRGVTARAA